MVGLRGWIDRARTGPRSTGLMGVLRVILPSCRSPTSPGAMHAGSNLDGSGSPVPNVPCRMLPELIWA